MNKANQIGFETENRSLPRLLLSGLDSLYVGFFVDFGNGISFPHLLEEKTKLQESRKDIQPITIGHETFALKPSGRFPYPVVLANSQMEVRLGPRMQPSCYVRFNSEALWHIGLDPLLIRLRHWLNSVGARELRGESLSRADWAFDFDLKEADFGPDWFVTRATKDVTWREFRKVQTIQLGTGNTVIRVYDKIKEILQQSGKGWFFDLWGQEENVWRIEFQLRGPKLKDYGIRNITTMKQHQRELLRDLTSKHTRLCVPGNDSNRNRWPTHPLWVSLQDAVEILPDGNAAQKIDPNRSIDLRIREQAKTLLGNLKGLGSLVHVRDQKDGVPALEDVLAGLETLVRPHYHEVDWNDGLKQRIDKLELGQK